MDESMQDTRVANISGDAHQSAEDTDTIALWESAYRLFETPEEETRKFMRRLLKLGAKDWRRDAAIIELFCGHGNGLHALDRLGFTRLEGVDLSARLIAEYTGPAKCYVADCRCLPFPDHSRDIAVIHGGLHHLAELPGDLEMTLFEIHRVLRAGGSLALVEPWMTPYLALVHKVCENSLANRLSRKVQALATMIELEQSTYGCWLDHAAEILAAFKRFFEPKSCRIAWGKLLFVGMARPQS
ncbi:MAG TPA: class I SAM-dependent methyltransferase [Syntrophobacteraceae bacterium]|nr:class I SAM-dependent methyltransferase [Syntrophobacteraceae bacterium]